ncbi:hypothetical protein BC831DRAFT_232340 [Entophlyctis helioformis]|nr:hypothetical protein BC831DRAFT_232340 [Entophlyctis helioformis]
MHAFVQAAVRRVQDAAEWFDVSGFQSSAAVAWTDDDPQLDTRFTVAFRVCGRLPLSCTVIYDAGDIEFPPDILVLGPAGFAPRLADIKPLVEWQPSNDRNLLDALTHIRRLYIDSQRLLISTCGFERISFEAGCLSHFEDLEMLLENDTNDVTCYFYIPFKHNAFAQKRAILSLTMLVDVESGNVSSVSRELLVPPKSQESVIQLPSYPLEGLVVDYVAQVIAFLDRTTELRISARTARKQLIESLAAEFQPILVEYDDVDYRFISLYAMISSEIEGKSRPEIHGAAVINITLPKTFPDSAPTVTLISPLFFRSEDSHIPVSKEWRIPYNRLMTVVDIVDFFRSEMQAQVVQFHSSLGR